MRQITEAKDVTTYKKLLEVLVDYDSKIPATGLGKFVTAVIDKGKKVLPKDKFALNIINWIVFSQSSTPSKIHSLLNLHFSNLPIDKRPLYKDGRKTTVASWMADDTVSSQVKSLLNIDTTKGQWVDINGNKVTIITK